MSTSKLSAAGVRGMSPYLASHGADIIANGYHIIPILPGTKRPVEQNWTSIEATPDMLQSWLDDGKGPWGVGILGKNTPGVDIDTTDTDVLQKVEAWCADNIGASLTRIGRAPRSLLLFRADKAFPRFKSRSFKSPDGETHQVEIIAAGGQFVAYATHPGTGRPYEWPNGGPADYPADLLPTIDEAKARELVAFFENIVPADWTPVQRADTDGRGHDGNPNKTAPQRVLESALTSLPNADLHYDDWIRVAHAVRAATVDYPEDGRLLFHQWSGKSEKYQFDETERAWGSIVDVKSIGAGTLFHLAEQQGWTRPVVAAADEFDAVVVDVTTPAPNADTLRTVSAASFADAETPVRKWRVPNIIPDENVTIINGDGATGKSLLAMQLGIAAVARRSWMGEPVTPSPVLYFSAEDDAAETHIRVKEICAAEHIDVADLQDLRIAVMAGENCILATDSGGKGSILARTKLFRTLDNTMAAVRPGFLILDNLADIYGANENVRELARQFIGMLRSLAIKHHCAVILLAHPSLAGMASGSGSSGNTAWNNSPRARLYLQRDKDSDGVEADPNLRILEIKKANYTAMGRKIEIRWEAGRFVSTASDFADLSAPDDPDETPIEKAERVFLKLVEKFNKINRNVAVAKGVNYAPKMFAGHNAAERVPQRHFEIAMENLLEKGQIVIEKIGPASRARQNITLARGDSTPLPPLTTTNGVEDISVEKSKV